MLKYIQKINQEIGLGKQKDSYRGIYERKSRSKDSACALPCGDSNLMVRLGGLRVRFIWNLGGNYCTYRRVWGSGVCILGAVLATPLEENQCCRRGDLGVLSRSRNLSELRYRALCAQLAGRRCVWSRDTSTVGNVRTLLCPRYSSRRSCGSRCSVPNGPS